MPRVLLDMAMSLDGLIAGPNDEDHGLHNYFFSPSGPTIDVIEQGFKTTGTIIMGKRVYEVAAAQNAFADNAYQVPTFILTHRVPEKVTRGAESFTFVTDGIESALKQAKAASGERDVVIGGGANIAQQYLQAGLVDEIQIHLIPVLLGTGIRLFDHLDTNVIELEKTKVIDGAGVTHLRFQILK